MVRSHKPQIFSQVSLLRFESGYYLSFESGYFKKTGEKLVKNRRKNLLKICLQCPESLGNCPIGGFSLAIFSEPLEALFTKTNHQNGFTYINARHFILGLKPAMNLVNYRLRKKRTPWINKSINKKAHIPYNIMKFLLLLSQYEVFIHHSWTTKKTL